MVEVFTTEDQSVIEVVETTMSWSETKVTILEINIDTWQERHTAPHMSRWMGMTDSGIAWARKYYLPKRTCRD